VYQADRPSPPGLPLPGMGERRRAGEDSLAVVGVQIGPVPTRWSSALPACPRCRLGSRPAEVVQQRGPADLATVAASRRSSRAAPAATSATPPASPSRNGDLRSTRSSNAEAIPSSSASPTSRRGSGSTLTTAAWTSPTPRSASSRGRGGQRPPRSPGRGSRRCAGTAARAASWPPNSWNRLAVAATWASLAGRAIWSPASRRGLPLPFHHSNAWATAACTLAGRPRRRAVPAATSQLLTAMRR
jgi:hypothetical protein